MPLPADFGKGIALGTDDSSDAGGSERLRAGGRFAVMAAWFKRDIGGGGFSASAGDFQGFDFRVRAAKFVMPTFADHGAIADDDAADHRVRLDVPLAARGEFQGPGHEHGLQFEVGRRRGKGGVFSHKKRLSAAKPAAASAA